MDERHPTHLLIVGSMRSGTTLLNRLLNAHPAIGMIYHPTRFFESAADLRDLGPQGFLDRFESRYGYFVNLGPEAQERCRQAIVALPPAAATGDVYRALTRGLLDRRDAALIGEKYAGRGAEMHPFHVHVPDGKVIMIVRDPRDVLLSNRKRVEQEVDVETFWRGSHLMALDDWANLAVLHRSFDQIQGRTYLQVRYEDLVAGPEATLRRLCDFLGVAFAPEMLAEGALRHDDGREWRANTSHGEQYRSVSDRSVARYREGLSEGELLLVNALLADHLKFAGYSLDTLEPDTETLVEACALYLTLGRALREYSVPSPQLYAVNRPEEDNLVWFVERVVALLGYDRAEFTKGFLAGRRVTVREAGFRIDQAAEKVATEIVALRRSLEWMPPEVTRQADSLAEASHALAAVTASLPQALEALTREVKNVRAAVDRFPTPLNVVKRAIRKPPQ